MLGGTTEVPILAATTLCLLAGSLVYPSVPADGDEGADWEVMPSMLLRRYKAGAALLDGRVYVACGNTPVPTTSVEAFDLATESWSYVTDVPGAARTDPAVAALRGRLWRVLPQPTFLPISSTPLSERSSRKCIRTGTAPDISTI